MDDRTRLALLGEIHATGTSAEVKANTRHLVDKILARYCSAFTIYRELAQNSDDAHADTIRLHFSSRGSADETRKDRPNDQSEKVASGRELVTQVLYENNGFPFREQDWARLKSIAEGNPDETSIGMFGVGFYSVFSICESPIVVSDRSAMAFTWEKDQLFARRADNLALLDKNAATKNGKETRFVLNVREPFPFPAPLEFGSFLAAALTFTKHVKHAYVYFDESEKLAFTKSVSSTHIVYDRDGAVSKSASGRPTSGKGSGHSSGMFGGIFTRFLNVAVGAEAEEYKSGQGMMSVCRVSNSEIQVSALYAGSSEGSVSAHISQVEIETSVPEDLQTRIERVTKKRPPRRALLQFISASADDGIYVAESVGKGMGTAATATGAESSRGSGMSSLSSPVRDILSSFCPSQYDGRIFIGFKTHQTTGLAVHLSAPFYCTMERENIDFVDPALAVWNSEMAHISGIAVRLIYEGVMQRLNEEYQKDPVQISDAVLLEHSENIDRTQRQNEDQKQSAGFLQSLANFVSSGIGTVMEAAQSQKEQEDVLDQKYDPEPLRDAEIKALFWMNAHAFAERSTPSELVGNLIRAGFQTARAPERMPSVLTVRGVVEAQHARLPYHGAELFVSEMAVVRRRVARACPSFLSRIACVAQLSIPELIKDLAQQKPLSVDRAKCLLKWWIGHMRKHPQDAQYSPSLRSTLKVLIGSSCVFLNQFSSYAGKNIPMDLGAGSTSSPLPPETCPRVLVEHLSARELAELKWMNPLPYVRFAAYVVNEANMFSRPEHGEVALRAFAKYFNSGISKAEREELVSILSSLLSDKACIPTGNTGLYYRPEDSYLTSAALVVEDLPRVTQVFQADVGKTFLTSLGVREHVPPALVFSRLESLQWDAPTLIRYLTSIQSQISAQEMKDLQSNKYLAAAQKGAKSDGALFAPCELFMPDQELFDLGFRMLDWDMKARVKDSGGSKISSGKFRKDSAEGKFCFSLGMREKPNERDVILMVSREEDKNRQIALLEYLVANAPKSQGANPANLAMIWKVPLTTAFIPTDDGTLRKPADVYIQPACAVLGLPCVDARVRHLAARLGVAEVPPISVALREFHRITQALANGTLSEDPMNKLVPIWEYLGSRASDFQAGTWEKLRKMPLVPVSTVSVEQNSVARQVVVWREPMNVFFGGEEELMTSDSALRVGLALETVAVPTKPAESFLRNCGVKQSPPPGEVAARLLKEPETVFRRLGRDPVRYVELLRYLAFHVERLGEPMLKQMRTISFLLGVKRMSMAADDQASDLDRSDRIFLVDDTVLSQLFTGVIKECPSESILETFYARLGSSWLSTSVQREYFRTPFSSLEQLGSSAESSTAAALDLNERIVHRSALLVTTVFNKTRSVNSDKLSALLKGVKVQAMKKLEIMLTLQGHKRVQAVTAAAEITNVGRVAGTLTLSISITHPFDYFDVARALESVLTQDRFTMEQALTTATILETTLERLKARGFPVDRLVGTPESIRKHERQLEVDTARAMATATSAVALDNNDAARGVKNMTVTPAEDGAAVGREQTGLSTSRKDPQGPEKGSSSHPTTHPNPVMERQPSALASAGSKKNKSVLSALRKVMTGGRSHHALPGEGSSSKDQNQLLHKANESNSGSVTTAVNPSGDLSVPRNPDLDQKVRDHVARSLKDAVNACQNRSASSITTQSQLAHGAPSTAERSTCELIPGHELELVPRPADGSQRDMLDVFCVKNARSRQELVQKWTDAQHFSRLLRYLCGVFGLDPRAVCIYYDPQGRSIAFNANRTLHFNFSFYLSLHAAAFGAATLGLQGSVSSSDGLAAKVIDAFSYWYTVYCHELAHNFVSLHNRDHEFYLESFVQQYFGDFIRLMSALRLC
ncbi:hypothetical protein FVE85_3114 [Porphyridium purpureum]|uniref:Sacsin/Nov domain-containing protein n=1 Tax=Porphyridium purpureum TaxID=35688 RepID=A0A5J4YVW2_PORPP|nr:hypothetical protein FVE85_3114 [Porphyridium purpureum]|eukprot:POR8639..scf227_4